MAGGVAHQGIIAIVSEKPVLSLESLLDSAREPALVVVLDGVEDPRNLGAILRTAEAAGADGVMLPERHSAGLSETVSRASAGALEHVKVARVGNLVAGAPGAQGARHLGGGLRRGRQRALGRGGPDQARGARAGRRGPRHPPAGARALRPPGLDPAVRPHRLAQRVGGGRHRALRGRAPAPLRAERRAADPRARRMPRRRSSVPLRTTPRPIPARVRSSPLVARRSRRGRRRGLRAARRPERRRGVGPGAGGAEVGRVRPAAPGRRPASQGSPPSSARAGAPWAAAGRRTRRPGQRTRGPGGRGSAKRRRAAAKGSPPSPPRTS